MKLPQPFYCLPLALDAGRVREEVAALPDSAWAPHPNGLPGNSSVRLISVAGGENDAVDGEMLATPHLESMPYVRQVLASIGVVWSRSRLMRLAPGAVVPEHSDINYHWFNRVRLHMPVTTHPDVRFHCGETSVHMAAGELWLFDNWRLHRVENRSDVERVHLVADTSGSAAFWRFVATTSSDGGARRRLAYDPSSDARPLTERAHRPQVLPPAEVDLLIADLEADLAVAGLADGEARRQAYLNALEALRYDWRQLHALHGGSADGSAQFARLRDSVRAVTAKLADGLVMRSNGVAAQRVLEARVLQHLLSEPSSRPAPHRNVPRRRRPVAPLFVVAAPRSGSTLLYETLAVSPQFWTLGGEAHWLVESQPELRPGAPGVDSNRLTADACTESVAQTLSDSLASRAVGSDGTPIDDIERPRLLEKTPKNALRIPFLDRWCPDARFLFLWRDPRENIASILEAWRDGRWTTYRSLPGWDGPWSLLLPPGWQALRGRAPVDVAAFQWETTNRLVLDDLASLPRQRWHAISYRELLDGPDRAIRGVCEFLGIEFDRALAERVRAPLPLSRYTQTPPAADKWRRHESAIESVLPQVEPTWARLRSLPHAQPSKRYA